MPPADRTAWEHLGRLLAERRTQISPRYANRRTFAKERGMNWRTLYDIEAAKRTNFTPATLRAFESAYMLASGSLARALAGGELEPAPVPPAPPPLAWEDGGEGEPQGDAAWTLFPDDEVKRHVWRTPGMSERDRAELIKLIDRTRAEVRGGGEGPRRQERAS